MQKIIQISPYYPPHLGGMEIVAQEISEELITRGYSVQIITSTIGDVTSNKNKNSSLKALWSFEFVHTPIAPSLFWNLIRLPQDSLIHLHLAHIYWPEIVFAASKMRGIPYIVHFHLDVGPSGSLGALLPLYKKYILGHILRSARKIIVFSEAQANIVQEKYHIKRENIAIIPNGINEKLLIKDIKKKAHDPLHLLYIGRLSAQKRVDRLIGAMALIETPAILTIVGDGEQRGALQAQMKRLDLTNVTFEGKKNSNELMRYRENADVFLISSDREGMPLALLEAMGARLPIVGSDVIGIRELIEGVGIVVKDPSPETFAHVINDIAKHPEQLYQLSEASAKDAQDYSWSKLVNKLEEVYKGIQT